MSDDRKAFATTATPATATGPEASDDCGTSKWVILVHGGAGDLTAERAPMHAAGCALAAEVGAQVLRSGGHALDAVEAAVRALEDDPHFNAGTGAALNEEGEVELDASIMDGIGLRAGSVAVLPPFKNPIAIARAVLEEGRHVMYAGEGAARFAKSLNFTPSTQEAMRTEQAVEKWKQARAARLDWGGPNSAGTVGAVARDAWGHVAAATSTGGTTDKRVGRVGDTPIIGGGTYADDLLGACSTTGHGESFIRTAFAARAVGMLGTAPTAVSPEGTFAKRVLALLRMMTERTGGDGGAILVDRAGRAAWARNTKSLSWAIVRRAEGVTDDQEQRESGA